MTGFKAIEKRAERLLASVEQSTPPVRLQPIVEKLDLELIRVNDWSDSIAAAIIRGDPGTRPVLGVNANHPIVRQRFSVAHEIGHVQLHKRVTSRDMILDESLDVMFRQTESPSNSVAKRREVEANVFAASLLMPRAWLRRDYDELHPVEFVASALARRYRVSESAMTYRLANLNLGERSMI